MPTANQKPVDFCELLNLPSARSTLTLFTAGPLTGQTTDVHRGALGARFDLADDLSPLFPYINAVAEQAQYYERPVYIKFLLSDRLCAFHPRRGAFTPVEDMADAMFFLPRLLDFIADVARRSTEIAPNHKKFKPVSAMEIYRLLPGTNCRRCGYATCLAFAAALSRQHTAPAHCPHLARPIEEKATFPVFDREGNLVQTVSLEIDTAELRRRIDQKESDIEMLKARLAEMERRSRGGMATANATLPAPLTRREIEVLRWVVRGATNKQISRELKISEHTVKSHVIHIFNKLGVNDRAQASAWGALHGLL